MAIRLTDQQLSALDNLVTPADPGDDWVVSDGGSAIRCDVEGMTEEVAQAPAENRSAQTLDVLRAYQANAIAARLS